MQNHQWKPERWGSELASRHNKKVAAAFKAALNLLNKAGKQIEVESGEYDLSGWEINIRLDGEAVQLPDTERTPTVNIPMKEVLMLSLEKAGVVGKHLEKMVFESMAEVVADPEGAREKLKGKFSDYEEMEKRVKASLNRLKKKTVKGAFKVSKNKDKQDAAIKWLNVEYEGKDIVCLKEDK